MNSKKEVQHVYLVGAKSLGAYGGYETFVYKLTEYHQNKENIKYHVACKANGDGCMDESKFDGVTRINEHEFELHNDKFLNELEEKLHFKSDKRIKFVGTVYDQELLKKIRENAYAYFHGHTVGGTNPSLIEALGSTDLNLLVDVGFNKEVAEDCALYWSRKPGSLAKLIDKADQMNKNDVFRLTELLDPTVKIVTPSGVYEDMQKFVDRMENETVDVKQLGLVGRTKEQILQELVELYALQ